MAASYVLVVVAVTVTLLFSIAIWASVVQVQLSQADNSVTADNDVNVYVRGTPGSDGNTRVESNSKVLFRENTDGFASYRLPAIVYHRETFLAFCEGRMGTADSSVSRIVMKRGLLNGTQIVWDKTHTVVARINQTRLANPVPLVDNVTDTIFLAYNVLPAHVTQETFLSRDHYNQSVLLTTSTDLGLTWSEPQNITEETLGRMKPAPIFYAPGPGHGIQMKSGRLVLQGNFYRKDTDPSHTTYKCNTSDHATVFISDNHGKSWRPGGYVPYGEDANGSPIHTSESTVVELANNTLCINSRTLEKSQPRSQSFSTDGGENFGNPQLVKALVEPENPGEASGCEGSILGFPAQDNLTATKQDTHYSTSDKQSWVLFSNPANSVIRLELSVRLSTDGCQTWSKPWTIWDLASGYSDLVQYEVSNSNNVDDDEQGPTFAILYESGYIDTASTVSFMTFTLKDVIHGIKTAELQDTNRIV